MNCAILLFLVHITSSIVCMVSKPIILTNGLQVYINPFPTTIPILYQRSTYVLTCREAEETRWCVTVEACGGQNGGPKEHAFIVWMGCHEQDSSRKKQLPSPSRLQKKR